MSNTKITYLLGSGASCGIRDDDANLPNYAMPLVKEIPQRLELMLNILVKAKKFISASIVDGVKSEYGLQRTYKELLEELIVKFEIFKENVKSHASIDTYAKKVYFTDSLNSNGIYEKYEEVKALIDLYFLFEHFFVQQDIRYDLFIASILKGYQGGNIKLPESTSIITWNYDIQFETSLANFYHAHKLKEIRNKFLIYPGRELDVTEDEMTDFNLIHINGVSGAYYSDNHKKKCQSDDLLLNSNTSKPNIKKILSAFENKDKSLEKELKHIARSLLPIINSILRKYALYSTHAIFSSIKFAWELEHSKVPDEYYRLPPPILRILKNTDILVIIGYSFPTFNREIDKIIFKRLRDTTYIFLQVPEKMFSEIEVKINSLSFGKFDNPVKKINILNEFFIPYEFVG